MTHPTRTKGSRARRQPGIDGVLSLIESVRREPARREALIEFLHDENPVYRNLGALDVVRLRGFVMQVFGEVGLPDDALSFVFEDLESSYDAYAVAAAARALRGWAAPSTEARPLLARALQNVRGADDYVSFRAYGADADPAGGTTASAEIQATMLWLEATARIAATRPGDGGRPGAAGCCCISETARGIRRFEAGDRTQPSPILALEFEDHDARTITFAGMFKGLPSIVAFFYTRCENPRKCSLTVAKLGRLQSSLAASGLSGKVRIAAITYDPLFDSPDRLKAYAIARNFVPDDDHRLLRAKTGMRALQDHFSLGVNYVQSIVNRHRIELYVLDAEGRVATSFVRLEWDEKQVIDEVGSLLR